MKNSWVFFVLTFVSILHIGVCIECYKCDIKDSPKPEENECRKAIAEGFKTCTDDKGCYVKIVNSVTSRGCLKDIGEDKCENNALCKTCTKDDNCNKDDVYEVDCIECNSSENEDCKRPPSVVTKDCKIDTATVKGTCKSYVLNKANACFVNRDENTVTRGCLPKTPTGKETLSEDNSDCIKDLLCYTCDTTADPDCAIKDNKEWDKNKCPDYSTACYTCGDQGNSTKRGCGKADSGTCEYCYGDKCNKPKRCFSCDETDTNCAVADEKQLKASSCSAENEDCVVFINDKGKTIRGCKSKLGKDCKDEENCKACNEFQCNKILYPANRIKCYQCSNCADPPESSAACQNYVSDDQCYVKADKDDKMDRGCVSDLSNEACPDKCLKCRVNNCNNQKYLIDQTLSCIQCNETDENCAWGFSNDAATVCKGQHIFTETPACFIYQKEKSVQRGCAINSEICPKKNDNCKLCGTDGCNNESRASFHCYKCEGDACRNVTGQTPTKCDDDETGCYVKIKDSVTSRGCLKDLGEDKCENNALCKTCTKDDNCNKDDVYEVNCIECNSSENKDCKRPPPSVVTKDCKIDTATVKGTCKSYVLNKANACFVNRDENTVTRGCLPKTPTGKETLSEDNSDCIKDLLCYTCDTTADPDCAIKDNKEWDKKKCPEYSTACYTCGDQGNSTKRGCGKADSGTCEYCYGDKCNKPKRCFSCDETDTNCAVADEKQLKASSCSAENEDCVVFINDKGKTIRGCKSKLGKDCKEEENCKTCNEFQCNKILYPANRIKCYQCSNCADPPESSAACQNYVSDDQCYVKADKDDKMDRGCVSDLSNEACPDKCLKCRVNNCNNQKYLIDQTLSCIQCNETDENCAWGFSNDAATVCKGQHIFTETPACFIYQKEKSVQRGCAINSEICPKKNDDCKLCGTDGCNNESRTSFNCTRCRNDNPGEKSCEETADGIAGSKCDNPVNFDKKGCYIERDGKYVIRGCLADLGPELYAKCKDKDYNLCISCDTENCNTAKAPNGVGKRTISIFLLGISIMLMKWL